MKKIEKLNWEFSEYDHELFKTLVIVLKDYQEKINEIIDKLNQNK